MKVAFLSYRPKSLLKSKHAAWYHIIESLERIGCEVTVVDDFSSSYQELFKVKSFWYRRALGKNYLRIFDRKVEKNICKITESKLSKLSDIDLIFAPGTLGLSELKADKPIVVWTDATFAGMVDYYEDFANLAPKNRADGLSIDKKALDRSKIAIFRSDWAAQSAIEHYSLDRNKIKVLNFGSTLEAFMSESEIRQMISEKKNKKLQILFAGIDWHRKGGDYVLKTSEKLDEKGIEYKIVIAGLGEDKIPLEDLQKINKNDKIEIVGFLRKSVTQEFERFKKLFLDSHFFFLPSRAEAFGLVYADAASLGVPSLASKTGGIPSAVNDEISGFVLPFENLPEKAADIFEKFDKDRDAYAELSLATLGDYKNRLDWDVVDLKLKEILSEI